MTKEPIKIQFYLASTKEEYDRAIAWVRKRRGIDKDQIKEIGVMESSNLLGDPIDVYVFVFSASNETMEKLAKYMGTAFKYI